MRHRRRNPGASPAVTSSKPAATSASPARKSSTGLRNWLILGAAGVGGFWLYKNFNKKLDKEISKAASGKNAAAPDLNGPLVTKYQIASTRSPNCISAPEKGFVYAKITSTNPVTGYSTFSAPVAGHFTRRVLCAGGQKVAVEIKATPGLSGLMALGDLQADAVLD